MIDEATLELLSRHLDGDLTPPERRLVEARLAAEPALAAELAALERIRDGLRQIAAHEQPPVALDTALEPLRQSAPHPPVLRPVYRWLALAATLLVGATVTLQVARRELGPPADAPEPPREPRAAREAPYQLRPLPTPSVPEEQELLGAADHLLASPLPTPELPEPPVHTALGPLTAEERRLTAPPGEVQQRRTVEPGRGWGKSQARVEEHDGTAASIADEALREREKIATAGAAAPDPPATASARSAAPQARLESAYRSGAPLAVTLTLRTPAGPVVVRLASSIAESVPERSIRVAVRSGRISAVRETSTNEQLPLREAVARELTGVALEGVADGEYDATLRVD